MSSIEDIKWLREKTGCGIMEAKKAQADAGGDRDKALILIQQRGAASTAKRADRQAGEGIVEPYIHLGGQIGVLVELDCETDFVARMPQFRELAHEIAMQVAANNPRYTNLDEIPEEEVEKWKATFREQQIGAGKNEALAITIAEGQWKKQAQQQVLMEQPYIRDDSKTIRQLVQELAASTKENIVVRRVARFQVGS